MLSVTISCATDCIHHQWRQTSEPDILKVSGCQGMQMDSSIIFKNHLETQLASTAQTVLKTPLITSLMPHTLETLVRIEDSPPHKEQLCLPMRWSSFIYSTDLYAKNSIFPHTGPHVALAWDTVLKIRGIYISFCFQAFFHWWTKSSVYQLWRVRIIST